jgi:hypothetical protein
MERFELTIVYGTVSPDRDPDRIDIDIEIRRDDARDKSDAWNAHVHGLNYDLYTFLLKADRIASRAIDGGQE